MNAQDILILAQRYGVQIRAKDDQLLLKAKVQPPLELISLVEQYKPNLLIALLAGGASIIEPLEQANDGLTTQQQSALNGLIYLISVKQLNLISKGHLPDNATVRRQEWRDDVMKVLVLNRDRMEKLESDLYRMGAIVYDTHRIFVMVGAWQAVNHTYNDYPDFILSDATGRTFCQWYFASDRMH